MQHSDTTLTGTGYRRVEGSLSCVLTRFQVRSAWSLLRFYRDFRRIRRETRGLPGLVTSMFLVESFHTCYTLSLWRNETAILKFNTVSRAHVSAANGSFGKLRRRSGRPLLWSAQFALSGVSPHNLRWEGVPELEELGDTREVRRVS